MMGSLRCQTTNSNPYDEHLRHFNMGIPPGLPPIRIRLCALLGQTLTRRGLKCSQPGPLEL